MSNILPSTSRIESFSDGVFAIIITLLIFTIKVPLLTDLTPQAVLEVTLRLMPQFITFAISFFTIAIFWVNHHHFFHQVDHSDWKLMWWNNLLLFWLAIVPFTTDFFGKYTKIPIVVSIYSAILCLASLTFMIMVNYAFLQSDLIHKKIPKEFRINERNRTMIGVVAYFLAAVIAIFNVWIAIFIIFVNPIFYFIPTLVEEQMKNHKH